MVTRARIRSRCLLPRRREGKDLAFVQQKALQVGAVQSYMIDTKEEFAEEFALTALQAHTMYEGKYPLVSALSRPLIAKN